MSHNTFGHLFRMTTFGESHGPALGCVVDGCPPGIKLEVADIQGFLDKRRAADDGRRFHYGLTDRGRDVYPLTITLVQWADRHLPGGGTPPMRRVHRHCGATLDARVLCSHCKTELLPARVTFAKIGD